jgi:hypothetical protein
MTCTHVERPSDYKIYAYVSAAWTDITADAVTDNISANWGMKGYGENDRLAGTGQMTFTLNNTANKYIPGIVGVLTGWTIGVPIKVVITYDGVDYIRFRGFVSKLDPVAGAHANEARVKVTVLDWMDYAARYPLVSPAIQLNKTADVALTTILADMPIPPQATDFDTGTQTFQALFDTVTTGTKAYTEFQKLALSELGYIFLKKDATYGETLRFESATYRNGSRTIKQVVVPSCDSGFLLNEDGSYLLNEDGSKFILDEAADVIISNTMLNMSVVYGKNVINRATARAHPKKTDTSAVVLFSLDTPIAIAAGETITFKGRYSDPMGGLQVNAINGQMLSPIPYDENNNNGILLHFNGKNNSTETIDETGKSWVMKYGAQLSTTEKKFGVSSVYLNGDASQLYTYDNVDLAFYSRDFTIHWWEYKTAITQGYLFLKFTSRLGTQRKQILITPLYSDEFLHNEIFLSSDGINYDIANGEDLGPIELNKWIHYAIIRNGNSFYTFRNGILISTWTSTQQIFTQNESNNAIFIGGGGGGYTGYIEEFQLIIGTALWTSNFTPPTSESSINILSDYSANTAEDNSGTDLTTDLTVSVIYGAEAPIYTLTNTSVTPGYVTRLNAAGYGVYAYNPIEGTAEDTTSILAYGENAETIDQLYQRDLTAGQAWATAIVAAEKDPRLVLESVTMNANTSGTLMQAFLNCDVGDMVHVEETRTGINGNFYIQNVSYEIQPGGIINFTWGLKEQL